MSASIVRSALIACLWALPLPAAAQSECARLGEAMLCLENTPWAGLEITESAPQRFVVTTTSLGLRIGVSDILTDADGGFAASRNAAALERMIDHQGSTILARATAEETVFGRATFTLQGNDIIAFASSERIGARRYLTMTMARGAEVSPALSAAHMAALAALRPDPALAHQPCVAILSVFACYGATRWPFLETLTEQGRTLGVEYSLNTGAEVLVFAVSPEATMAELAAADLQGSIRDAAAQEGELLSVNLPFDAPSAAVRTATGMQMLSYTVIGETLLYVKSAMPADATLPDLITLHDESLSMLREDP